MGFSDWIASWAGSAFPVVLESIDDTAISLAEYSLALDRATERMPPHPADVEKLCDILRSAEMDLHKGFELLRNKLRSGDPDTVFCSLEILDKSIKLCGVPLQTAFLTKSCMDELSGSLESYGPLPIPTERLPIRSGVVRKRILEILICWNHAIETQFDFAKILVRELREKGYHFPCKKDPRTLQQFVRRESCRCGLILDALSKQCVNCNQLFCSTCSPGAFGLPDPTEAVKDLKTWDGDKNSSKIVGGPIALPEAKPEARRVENNDVLVPVQTRLPRALRETVDVVRKKEESWSWTDRTDVHIPVPDGDFKPTASAKSLFWPKPGPPANHPMLLLAAGPRSKPKPSAASYITPKIAPATLLTSPLRNRYGKLTVNERPSVTSSAVPKPGGPVAAINVKKEPIVRPSRASLLKKAHVEPPKKPQPFSKASVPPASQRIIQTNAVSAQPEIFPQQVQSAAWIHCDIILRSNDGKQVPAKSAVLRARAPAFATVLFGDLGTVSSQKVFEVDDMDRATLYFFVQFMNGRDGLQFGVVAEDLLAIADKYGQEELKILCAKELQNSLTSYSAGRILLLASRYGLEDLKNSAVVVN